MVVAFYYHYPVFMEGEKKYLPGFLGCFLHALAQRVEKLIVVAHRSQVNKNNLYDYELGDPNIEFIWIRERTAAWHRHLFHHKILSPVKNQLSGVDFFIVRSPSPLAPFFKKYISPAKLIYMIVGDYRESVEQMPSQGFRNKIMKSYIRHNDRLFRKAMHGTDLLVNSPSLYEKYKTMGKSIHLIRTTTLSNSDFYDRENTCLNKTIRLLYTGRLDWAKGLNEMAEAFIQLKKEGEVIHWDIVGWEDSQDQPVEKALTQKIHDSGFAEDITFHGKKKIGEELNAMYRQADLYFLPSYHEGFPRTIWEAMAQGLPVVATTVGAIPQYLRHEVNAILIQPKSVSDIVKAFRTLKSNAPLRRQLISNGYDLAKENTLEIQTTKMVETLAHLS